MQMLDHGYRVPVGQIHPVGFVAQTGQPRIVQLENEEFAALRNPALPETRSELVLPLKAGDQIIGVLDIQSAEGNAFVESDISTLSILADQIAITIQNSFLYRDKGLLLRWDQVGAIERFEGIKKGK
jgi:GAF domain-containing protein